MAPQRAAELLELAPSPSRSRLTKTFGTRADRHRGATLSVVRVEDKSEKGCKCVHKGTDFDRVSR